MNRYTLNMHRIFIVVLLGILQFGSKSVVLADYCEPSEQPNIVVILCDDVGFDDIGLHGNNQIPTPNIDAILTHGVNFQRYYSGPMCTPARSSLMTGKYAAEVGMQHYVIPNDQPYGLSLDEKLLPEYLHELGYKNHMIGKWHLGFYRKKYTAIHRHFDSFFGYQGGLIDYYNHTSDSIGNSFNLVMDGYDMRRNATLAWDTQGQYATDLFTNEAVETILNHDQTDPMFLYISHLAGHAGNEALTNQAPIEVINKFAYIKDPKRRDYAAVISKLDESVGKVFAALEKSGMLPNTVVTFMSDNGSPIVGELHNGGSDFPYRGQKDSPWEGASHVVGGLWAPFLSASQRVSTDLFHVTDWLPTIVHLAGGYVNEKAISGFNQWPSICRGTPGPRKEILINIDQAGPSPYRALIIKDWKLVRGTSQNGTNDGWLCNSININHEEHPSFRHYGQSVLASPTSKAIASCTGSEKNAQLTSRKLVGLRKQSKVTCNNAPLNYCDPRRGPCLFNIVHDPCERNDLSQQFPHTLHKLQHRLDEFEQLIIAPRNKPDDPNSNPKYFNGTWTWWYDMLGVDDDDAS